MGTRRLVLPLVLLAAVLPAAAWADARIVVDSGAVRDGQLMLQPAVATWSGEGLPAVFRLANGADQAEVTARLSIGVEDSADVDLGTVTLAPGEIATITLDASILPSPTSVLRVDVDGGSTLQAFAVEESHRPTASIEPSEGGVLLRSDEPTVVSLQVRQRSWLGVVSSELVHAPVFVGTDPRPVETGGRPWPPGPWWVDVLVVDHAGTVTRLTVRRSDLGRDALVALGLVVVVGLAVSLSLRRRSAQASAD